MITHYFSDEQIAYIYTCKMPGACTTENNHGTVWCRGKAHVVSLSSSCFFGVNTRIAKTNQSTGINICILHREWVREPRAISPHII